MENGGMKMKKILLLLLVLLLVTITACNTSDKSANKNQYTNDSELALGSNVSSNKEIDDALTKIISSPKESSNPGDYINENKTDFDYIVSKGSISLNYLTNRLESSLTDGLEEYIMATVCIEILGELNPVENWSSGKDWYGKYMSEKS